jgi:hypothetical protein
MTRRYRRMAAALAAIAFTALTAFVGAPAASAGSAAVPYTDPRSVGFIGLCNSAGQQITTGSISTRPFVVRAVDSKPAAAPYNATGRTATLYAYQPREGLPPGAWSGEVMTAAGRYSSPAHPMTAGTPLDDSLADFMSDYPLSWNNLIQLRMYLGAPNEPIDSVSYPTINLKVTGKTWKVVGASGKVSCTAGSSVSVETILLPSSQLHPSSSASQSSSGKPTGGKSSTAAGSGGAAAGPGGSGGGSVSPHPASASSHSHVSVVEIFSILVVVIGLAAAVSWFVRRRRDRTFFSRHFSGSQS